ncbi:MAG: toprim domain-containing protein [Candidatus Micrarchaeia archaeon]
MSLLANLIREDFGVKSETQNWFKAKEHDSIVVDKEKNIFYWNSQGLIGNAYVYLTKVRKWSPEEAKEYLKNTYLNLPIVKANRETVKVYDKLVYTFFINGLDKRDYFYKRGLTDDTINAFLLGYYNGWSTVPIFEDGQFRNFQLRRDNPKMFCNYYRGIGQLIFNVDILKFVNEIFITEGAMDALILIQNGIPAIASSGGGIQNKYFRKFVNIKRINILFDNDSAGYQEAKRTARTLGEERCYIYLFQEFKEKYDPVDFFRDGHTKDELLDLVYKKSKKAYQI